MNWIIACSLAVLAFGSLRPVSAQTDTTFTYQGTLDDQGAPASGSFNLNFTLFDALIGGSQIGSAIVMNSVAVSDGLLTAELDFGASAFDNTSRWLEIEVNGNTLSPRQPISRSPYAIQTRGIVVDENNNVGIGTESPAHALHVESDTLRAVFGHNTSSVLGSMGVVGRSDSIGGRGLFGYASLNTGLNYGVMGSVNSPDAWAGYFIGRAYVEDKLFVGRKNRIGSEYFGVHAPVTGTTYGGMYISTDSDDARPFYGYAAGGNADMWHYYDGDTEDWHVYNGGSNRMTVASNGNVFVGPVPSFNSARLRVTSNNRGIQAETTSSGAAAISGRATSTSGINYGVLAGSNAATGFDFYADGAGQNYGSSSSRRWKSKIEPIAAPLEKLSLLRGVYFDWDDEHGGHHDLGMIAEEVGEVLPEIVNYEDNGVDAIGMDYSKMTPLLVEAVNALRSEKDSQIARLEVENQDLRSRLEAVEQMVVQLASMQGDSR